MSGWFCHTKSKPRWFVEAKGVRYKAGHRLSFIVRADTVKEAKEAYTQALEDAGLVKNDWVIKAEMEVTYG